ncbi:hypothetical protein BLOT_002109 [Blomia tropicalis]|nr:hypothetical protein BLOT_002109 [Blomia tropicalis]
MRSGSNQNVRAIRTQPSSSYISLLLFSSLPFVRANRLWRVWVLCPILPPLMQSQLIVTFREKKFDHNLASKNEGRTSLRLSLKMCINWFFNRVIV